MFSLQKSFYSYYAARSQPRFFSKKSLGFFKKFYMYFILNFECVFDLKSGMLESLYYRVNVFKIYFLFFDDDFIF